MLCSILLFFERKVVVLQLNSISFSIAMLLERKSKAIHYQRDKDKKKNPIPMLSSEQRIATPKSKSIGFYPMC